MSDSPASARQLLAWIDGLAALFMFGGVYAAGTFRMSASEVVALFTCLSGSQRVGMSAIILFMAIGLVIMLTVPSDK